MIEEPAATPEAAPTPAAGRTAGDEMLSIATGQHVISRIQNFEGIVMGWLELLIMEQMIRGQNATLDFRGAYLPMYNNLRAFIYFLGGKAKNETARRTGRAEIRRFFASVGAIGRDERIPELWNYTGYMLDRTRIGMPPEVPEGEFGYEPDVLFRKAAPKIADEVARRMLTK